MPKSIDGIKKLNPEEIKKNRKIVLNYIGEKDSEENSAKIQAPRPAISRQVDGLNFGVKEKSPDEESRLKQAIKKQEEERKRIKEEEKQFLLKKEREEKDRVFEAKKAVEKAEREEKEREKKMIAEAESARREKERKKIEEKKLEERLAAEAAEAKRIEEKKQLEERERRERKIAEENRRLEKEKTDRERARKKAAKRAARERLTEKRRKARRKFMKKIKRSVKAALISVKRNWLYIVLFAVALLAVVYAVFGVLVLRLGIGNRQAAALAAYLPVPAVITDSGVITYNEYRTLDNYEKNNLAKWVILRSFKSKYSLPSATSDQLAVKFVMDKDFNQAARLRINKIDQLIKNGGDFEAMVKYADEYDNEAAYDNEALAEKFGPAANGLKIGETSGVIARPDGFYILKKTGLSGEKIEVKYLFIKAESLDSYLAEKLKNAKIFILAN